MNKIRKKFNIDGLVQGVGYRYFVMREANRLELMGYAKNSVDGSVEVIVEGITESIDELHNLLKTGPSRAHVESVQVEEQPFLGNFKNFNVF